MHHSYLLWYLAQTKKGYKKEADAILKILLITKCQQDTIRERSNWLGLLGLLVGRGSLRGSLLWVTSRACVGHFGFSDPDNMSTIFVSKKVSKNEG